METEFTLNQRRALAIATVAAIAFGAYFLRGYFILIVVAAVVAYLFDPIYQRLHKRFGTGLSATFTLLAALAIVIVPIAGGAVAIGGGADQHHGPQRRRLGGQDRSELAR